MGAFADKNIKRLKQLAARMAAKLASFENVFRKIAAGSMNEYTDQQRHGSNADQYINHG